MGTTANPMKLRHRLPPLAIAFLGVWALISGLWSIHAQHRRALIAPQLATSPVPATGLGIWLKAESLTPEGDVIKLWPSSGNTNYYAGGSISWPYYSNAVVNGYAAMRFTGAGTDILYFPNATNLLNNVGSASFFVVLKQLGTGAMRPLLDWTTGTDAYARFAIPLHNGNFWIDGRRVDTESTDTSDFAALPNVWVLMCVKADWASQSVTVWTNGVQAFSDASWTTAGNTSDTNSVTAILGNNAAASASINAMVAEVISYVPALDAAGQLAVQNYLSNKFRIWP